jgi:hypothetical protein
MDSARSFSGKALKAIRIPNQLENMELRHHLKRLEARF